MYRKKIEFDKMSKGLEVDLDKCTGCRLCEMACSMAHSYGLNPHMSRIKVEMFDVPEIMGTVVCKQCEEPAPCQEACPVDVITRDSETSAIQVDMEGCISCGQCLEACPIDAVRYTPDEEKALICDLCDGDPECVKICPPDCIEIKDIEDIGRDLPPKEEAEAWLEKIRAK